MVVGRVIASGIRCGRPTVEEQCCCPGSRPPAECGHPKAASEKLAPPLLRRTLCN